MKTNENEGAVSADAQGFATPQDTPGMGDVVLPSAEQRGSGDVWPNLMDFMTWRQRKKKKQRKKRR